MNTITVEFNNTPTTFRGVYTEFQGNFLFNLDNAIEMNETFSSDIANWDLNADGGFIFGWTTSTREVYTPTGKPGSLFRSADFTGADSLFRSTGVNE